MGRPLYTNNAASALAAGITSTQTTIQVQDGMGILFPSPAGGDYCYITVTSISLGGAFEIMQCTARSGDTLTVVRGAEGTNAQSFNIGDNVQLRVTAAGMNFLTGNVVTSTQIQEFTATQGQTVFTLTNFNYAPSTNNLSVFVNGSKQIAGVNFTETNVNTFTFSTGLNVGDSVEAIVGLVASGGIISAGSVSYTPGTNSLIPAGGTVATALNDLSDKANGTNYIGYNQGSTGGTNRVLTSKLKESVSVKDFGAVGDGITDDTSAIQAAITYGGSVGGADIYFPTGTYKVTSTLNMAQLVRLIGTSKLQGGSSQLVSTASSIFSSTQYIYFDLLNMNIKGVQNNTQEFLTVGGGGFNSWSYSTVEGCYFVDIPKFSLLLTGVSFVNNNFQNVTQITLRGADINFNYNYVSNYSDSTILTATDGLVYVYALGSAVFNGNYISSFPKIVGGIAPIPLLIYNSQVISVTENRIDGGSGASLLIGAGSAGVVCNNNKITSITPSPSSPIQFANCYQVNFNNNMINGLTANQPFVNGGSTLTDIIIRDNITNSISDTTKHDFTTGSGYSANTITLTSPNLTSLDVSESSYLSSAYMGRVVTNNGATGATFFYIYSAVFKPTNMFYFKNTGSILLIVDATTSTTIYDSRTAGYQTGKVVCYVAGAVVVSAV